MRPVPAILLSALLAACGSSDGNTPGVDPDAQAGTLDGGADADVPVDPCDAVGTTPGVCPHRGLYTDPVDVEIRAPEGATLMYTLDGSEPTVDNGTAYDQPITISAPSVGAAQVLRVATVRLGLVTGQALHSYVFTAPILSQPAAPTGYPTTWGTTDTRAGDYEMDPTVLATLTNDEAIAALEAVAIVSIVTPHERIWSDATGIYMNPSLDGIDWEREVSFEFIDGTPGVQSGAGLRIQGGSSVNNWKSAKLSMRLLFKDIYGAKKLKYKVFEDTPVEKFNGLILDAHLNMTYLHPDHGQRVRALYSRDAFMSDLQNLAGGNAPHDRFVHLLINGIYWGVYDLHERPDDEFAESYLGGLAEEYDVLKHTGDTIVDGDAVAWDAMMAIARGGLSDDANLTAIEGYLDLDDFITYMLINMYGGNDDWPHHNWYAARHRSVGSQFRFFSWDAEHVLKNVNVNRFGVNNSNTPGELWQALLGNASFVASVNARLDVLLAPGGAFYVNSASPAVDSAAPENNVPGSLFARRALEFHAVMPLESARWGDNRRTPAYGQSEWQAEYDDLMQNYFPQRSGVVSSQRP